MPLGRPPSNHQGRSSDWADWRDDLKKEKERRKAQEEGTGPAAEEEGKEEEGKKEEGTEKDQEAKQEPAKTDGTSFWKSSLQWLAARQIDRQAGGQTDRDRQTDRQTDTNRPTDRKTDRKT